jgi:cytoskeletal protein CcmA (bactofilin family)
VIRGSTQVTGNVQSDHLEIHGSSNIEGYLNFRKLEVKGTASLQKGAKGEDIFLEGMVKIGGDCEAETALLNGAFTIDGLFNADNISITLHAKSSVKEIGGETITVRRNRHVISLFEKWIKSLRKELEADLIEGDVLNLQYTKAKIVRGNTVHIGPGCEIELVEYRKDLHLSEEAVVKESAKV